MARRILYLVLRRLGVPAVLVGGGGATYSVYTEFEDNFQNFSTMETDLVRPDTHEMTGIERYRHLAYDLAYRYLPFLPTPLDVLGSRFLKDMNSLNPKERNDSLHFLKNELNWLANHPDANHIKFRISHSRIIHSIARLEHFYPELFIEPQNPQVGSLLAVKLMNIFKQLPSTKLLSDEELFTPCVKFFTEIAIKEIEEAWESSHKAEISKDMIGDNFDSSISFQDAKSEDAGILMLLKALRRYCEDPQNYKNINTDRLFQILLDVIMNDHSPYKSKSLEMRQIALRCLANLALDKHLTHIFIQLGIHKVLRKCVEDDKVYYDDDEVCFNQLLCRFQAQRALANLDIDNPEGAAFHDGVFQVTPKGRVHHDIKKDIVFVHGLGGSAASTWVTQTELYENGEFEKKRVNWVDQWIGRDLADLKCRILSVDYETAIIFDQHQCPFELEKRTIEKLAKDLGSKLIAAGVGDRDTMFVCYSMGGLVLKKMLEINPEIGKRLKGCLFLATPHFGSPVAKLFVDEKEELVKGLKSFIHRYRVVTPEVVMLGNHEESLEDLNDKFIDFVKLNNIKVMSWGEELLSDWYVKKLHIVDLATANPGIGTFETSKKDHDGMVMPIDEVDPLYSKSLVFIREALKS